MEAAFAWIGRIFDFILSLFPSLITIDANQGGVKYPGGKEPVELGAGVHFYWPLVTNEPTVVSTARQTINLASQHLTTPDDAKLMASAVVIGHVVDVVKAIHETEDYEDTIADAALRAMIQVIMSRDVTTLRDDMLEGKVENELTITIRRDLKKFGFHVERAFISDLVEANILAHIGIDALRASGDHE